MKWKASEGKLVLKITDDTTVREQFSSAVDLCIDWQGVVSKIQDALVCLPQPL